MEWLFISFLFLLNKAIAFDDWDDEFEHSTELEEDVFQLYWTANTDECNIEFGLAVETSGWVAIGISLTGSMASSDIVLGWIDDTTSDAYLYNFYAEYNGRPSLFDDQSGIDLIEAEQREINGTITTFFRFEKELFPSSYRDNAIDVQIGTTRVIYAFHDDDPIDNDPDAIAKHAVGDRSTKSLDLLVGQTPAVPMEADTQTYELRQPSLTIPDASTTYMCTLLELPDFGDVNHIIRVDPVIDEGMEAHVHHILVYDCPESFVDPDHVNIPWDCDDGPNMASNTTQCRLGTIKFAWAVGGGSFYTPEGVGLPIGGTTKQYVLFETHYDNPREESGMIDSSGLTFYHTPTLRPESAAFIGIGDGLDQFIPPGVEELWNYAYFGGQCSADGLPEDGVHIFANMHHQHLLGRKGIVRHIRDGVELSPIDVNLGYDFNFQQFVPKKEEILLLPGDEIILECGLDSRERDVMTYGGESTQHEMCITFLVVYPIPEVAGAYGTFSQEKKEQFFNDAAERGYWDGQIYDASMEGAMAFYNEFHSHDTQRSLYCKNQDGDCVYPACTEVLDPATGFEEYDGDYYFGCVGGEEAASTGFEFEWDGWYVYTFAAVILVVLIGLIALVAYCCRSSKYRQVKGQEWQNTH